MVASKKARGRMTSSMAKCVVFIRLKLVTSTLALLKTVRRMERVAYTTKSVTRFMKVNLR
jgi:hypothetical protein